MFNLISRVVMAETSGGMLPNGRASSAQVPAESAAQFVKAKLAEAETAEAVPGARTTATGTQIVTVDEKLVNQGKDLIMGNIREAGNLTRKLFNLIRACGSWQMAEGTLVASEGKAIDDYNKQAEKEIPPAPAVRTLGQLAEALGQTSLSYTQTKSRILSACKTRKDLRDTVQRFYDYKERLERAPKVIVQKEWLDLWSARYADTKHGGSQFMKDIKFSKDAEKECNRYAKQLQAEQRQRQDVAGNLNRAAGADSNATDAVTGVRSGTRQRPSLAEDIQALLNGYITKVHEAYEIIDLDFLRSAIKASTETLEKRIVEERDATRAQAAQAGNSPVATPTEPLVSETVPGMQGPENKPIVDEDPEEWTEDNGGGGTDGEDVMVDELPELSDEDQKHIAELGDDMEQTGTGR